MKRTIVIALFIWFVLAVVMPIAFGQTIPVPTGSSVTVVAVPATTQPPVNIPVTHVTISASFTGYDSKGKMIPSTVDTFGVAIYRNQTATRGFDADYEHIAVPELGQRWELGLGCPWQSLPRIKSLLIDTSNFIATECVGVGKLLSATDGNRLAYTASAAITYPIANHMAWTISYQYLHATGGISGVVNKSYQSVGTGPQIHF